MPGVVCALLRAGSLLTVLGSTQILVGVGLPVMGVNDNAGAVRLPVMSGALFASRLAPTVLGSTQFLAGVGLAGDGRQRKRRPSECPLPARFRAAGSLLQFSGSRNPVGAGLPAMDVNDNAGCLNAGVVCAFREQACSYRFDRVVRPGASVGQWPALRWRLPSVRAQTLGLANWSRCWFLMLFFRV